MTQWVAFATIVTLLSAAMVALTRQTQRALTPVEDGQSTARETPAPTSDAADPSTTRSVRDDAVEPSVSHSKPIGDGISSTSETRSGRIVAHVGDQPVTSRALRWNVLATQLLFLAIVAGVIVLTGVPPGVLGISISRQALVTGLGVGLGAGFGLYAASELAGAIGRRFGMTHDEWLRESLAPSGRRGWIGLFAVVLPVIAIFEELLFRAVLVGALSVGFGLSPWLLAVASSILFAVGHGVQGRAGVVVTGVIGFVLAATFVATGNFLAVVVAHYVLNGCEFAVYEYVELGSMRP